MSTGSAIELEKLRLDQFADLRDCASSPASEQELAHIASRQQEMAKYKAMKVPAAAETPLIFWKENAQEFPILSLTTRRILCISASSAQSERDFSSVGRTVTDMRSRLSADKVEAIELVRWGRRAGLSDD